MPRMRISNIRYGGRSVRYLGGIGILIAVALLSMSVASGGESIGTHSYASNDSVTESEEDLFVAVESNETGTLGETVNITLVALSPKEDEVIDWFEIQIVYDNAYLAFDTAGEAEAGPVTVTDGGPGYAVFENEYELGDVFFDSVTTPVEVATLSFTVIGSDGNATITADEDSAVGWGVDLAQTEYDVEWDRETVHTQVPNGTLSGMVMNESGDRVQNATVTSSDATVTATDGTYTLSLPAGNTTLTASAPGYEQETATTSVSADESTSQSFTLTESGDDSNGDNTSSEDEKESDEKDGGDSEKGEENGDSDDKNEPEDENNTNESDSDEQEDNQSKQPDDDDESEDASDNEDSSPFSASPGANASNDKSSSQSTEESNTTDESTAADESGTDDNTSSEGNDDTEVNESHSRSSSTNKSDSSQSESKNSTTDAERESQISTEGSLSLAAPAESVKPGDSLSPLNNSSDNAASSESETVESGVFMRLGHGVGTTGIFLATALILYSARRTAMKWW